MPGRMPKNLRTNLVFTPPTGGSDAFVLPGVKRMRFSMIGAKVLKHTLKVSQHDFGDTPQHWEKPKTQHEQRIISYLQRIFAPSKK